MQEVLVANNLYHLFESLSLETQSHFLQRLFQERREQLADLAFAVACQQAKEEADFLSPEEAEEFLGSLSK
jgi:hypothetical protein